MIRKNYATKYAPWLAMRELCAGFPKGRSNPLVKGGVKAPPAKASTAQAKRSAVRGYY